MSMQTNKLLVDEAPLLVLRSIVRAYGLKEALLLQQIHYWLQFKEKDPKRYKNHFINGRFWIHWTLAEMQQEVPFGTQSPDPYKRCIRKLEELGVLMVGRHGSAWDQTKWYSIDYDRLDLSGSSQSSKTGCIGGKATNASAERPLIDQRESRSSIGGIAAEDYQGTENTQENTTTAPGVVVAPGTESSLGESARITQLIFDGIPADLHREVEALIAGRADGQRFVDLLAAALRRGDCLPEPKRIHSPLLWLKKLLGSPNNVDFTAADVLADEREAAAQASQSAAERAAREVAAAEAQLAAQDARTSSALRLLRSMSEQALADFVTFVGTRTFNRKLTSTIAEAIKARQLPTSPLGRAVFLRALDEHCLGTSVGTK